MKRKNLDYPKLRRTSRRTKINEYTYSSSFIYIKFFLIWAIVLLADFMLEFRFEYLWPFWLLIRSVYDSFKYQGLAFSVFFVFIALTSDMICLLTIPVHWLFFAASTYVWVQFIWHTEKGICLPTISLWLLFVYIEASVRLRELKNVPLHLDLCRPFAAHCIGYPMVTLGFGFKSYIGYRLRKKKQQDIANENAFYYDLMKKALPMEYIEEEVVQINPKNNVKANGYCKDVHIPNGIAHTNETNDDHHQHHTKSISPHRRTNGSLHTTHIPRHQSQSHHHHRNQSDHGTTLNSDTTNYSFIGSLFKHYQHINSNPINDVDESAHKDDSTTIIDSAMQTRHPVGGRIIYAITRIICFLCATIYSSINLLVFTQPEKRITDHSKTSHESQSQLLSNKRSTSCNSQNSEYTANKVPTSNLTKDAAIRRHSTHSSLVNRTVLNNQNIPKTRSNKSTVANDKLNIHPRSRSEHESLDEDDNIDIQINNETVQHYRSNEHLSKSVSEELDSHRSFLQQCNDLKFPSFFTTDGPEKYSIQGNERKDDSAPNIIKGGKSTSSSLQQGLKKDKKQHTQKSKIASTTKSSYVKLDDKNKRISSDDARDSDTGDMTSSSLEYIEYNSDSLVHKNKFCLPPHGNTLSTANTSSMSNGGNGKAAAIIFCTAASSIITTMCNMSKSIFTQTLAYTSSTTTTNVVSLMSSSCGTNSILTTTSCSVTKQSSNSYGVANTFLGNLKSTLFPSTNQHNKGRGSLSSEVRLISSSILPNIKTDNNTTLHTTVINSHLVNNKGNNSSNNNTTITASLNGFWGQFMNTNNAAHHHHHVNMGEKSENKNLEPNSYTDIRHFPVPNGDLHGIMNHLNDINTLAPHSQKSNNPLSTTNSLIVSDTYKMEIDIKKLKNDLLASRSCEQELRNQILVLQNGEKYAKNEIYQLKHDNDMLQAKINSLLSLKHQEKMQLFAVEKRLAEEQKTRIKLETQLGNNNTHLDKKANYSPTTTTTYNSINKNECSELCKTQRKDLENDIKQLCKDAKIRQEQMWAMEKEFQSMRQKKEQLKDHEMLIVTINALKNKNVHLETSLNAETKLKLDLFTALSEAKRNLEINQTVLQRKEREISDLKSRLTQQQCIITSTSTSTLNTLLQSAPVLGTNTTITNNNNTVKSVPKALIESSNINPRCNSSGDSSGRASVSQKSSHSNNIIFPATSSFPLAGKLFVSCDDSTIITSTSMIPDLSVINVTTITNLTNNNNNFYGTYNNTECNMNAAASPYFSYTTFAKNNKNIIDSKSINADIDPISNLAIMSQLYNNNSNYLLNSNKMTNASAGLVSNSHHLYDELFNSQKPNPNLKPINDVLEGMNPSSLALFNSSIFMASNENSKTGTSPDINGLSHSFLYSTSPHNQGNMNNANYLNTSSNAFTGKYVGDQMFGALNFNSNNNNMNNNWFDSTSLSFNPYHPEQQRNVSSPMNYDNVANKNYKASNNNVNSTFYNNISSSIVQTVPSPSNNNNTFNNFFHELAATFNGKNSNFMEQAENNIFNGKKLKHNKMNDMPDTDKYDKNNDNDKNNLEANTGIIFLMDGGNETLSFRKNKSFSTKSTSPKHKSTDNVKSNVKSTASNLASNNTENHEKICDGNK